MAVKAGRDSWWLACLSLVEYSGGTVFSDCSSLLWLGLCQGFENIVALSAPTLERGLCGPSYIVT